MKLAAFLLGLAWSGAAAAQSALPSEVQAVVDRSKTTRVSYRVVTTSEISSNGNRWTETEAEFQQGSMHRVEVPATRVLANCDTGEAYVFAVLAGHLVNNPAIGAGACGIDMAVDHVISGRLLEPVSGDYGRADVIELTGTNLIRRYAVTEDGIIVATAYVSRRAENPYSMRTLTVTVTRGRQDPAMFEPGSLERYFVAGPPSPESVRPANSEEQTPPTG